MKLVTFLLIINCSNFAMQFTSQEQIFLQAAARGTLQTVKACLAEGVSINTEDKCGENALFKAVFHDNWKIAQFLIENGINLNYHPHNHGNNTTYLHLLATQISNREDETAAYFLLDSALKKGANPNPPDRHGDTPLDDACRKNNIACIRLLKKAGGVRKVRAIEP